MPDAVGAETGTRPKRVWLRVDGVLLLDKASGMSSNAALQSARRLFSAAKGGHTGTLDPLATGLLPLCFGEATKFSADLLDADKVYEADIAFGATTDTGDADGLVLARFPVAFDRARLASVLDDFRGPILQVPPMYSALKRDGQPLYKLARQGIDVERQARAVHIHALDLLAFAPGASASCRVRVCCSKGTYIRVLAEDVGRALGCGAHLTALRRVGVGGLTVADAVSLEQLAGLSENERAACLRPVDALLHSLPEIVLDADRRRRFMHGNPVGVDVGVAGKCRVTAADGLLGLGCVDAGSGLLRPVRLLATN